MKIPLEDAMKKICVERDRIWEIVETGDSLTDNLYHCGLADGLERAISILEGIALGTDWRTWGDNA